MEDPPVSPPTLSHSMSGEMIESFEVFGSVSLEFIRGYGRLVASGLPPYAVAQAMLGAAVNFYELYDIGGQLPNTLRALADRIEDDVRPS